MDAVRFNVQDCMLALLVTYLKSGSRNLITSYSAAWTAADRLLLVDNVSFRLCRKVPGERHEIPGINLMFYDEMASTLRTNPRGYSLLLTIHLYAQATDNVVADDRTLLKVQRLVDEALLGGSIPVLDLDSVTLDQIDRICVHWELLAPGESWQELTDLANTSYLHRSKNLQLFYDDRLLV